MITLHVTASHQIEYNRDTLCIYCLYEKDRERTYERDRMKEIIIYFRVFEAYKKRREKDYIRFYTLMMTNASNSGFT